MSDGAGEEEELLRCFESADTDGNGLISRSELHAVLEKVTSLNSEQIDTMFDELDQDEDGNLNYREFIKWLMQDEYDVADAVLENVADAVPEGGTGATTVVVIGAGMAGLAAARCLLDNWAGDGGLSVVVLEAGRRVGGRLFTNRSLQGWGDILGAEAEFGASWIHGSCDEHPISRIKDALGLPTIETDDQSLALFKAGVELEDDKFEAFEALVEEAKAVAGDSDEDVSLWQALEGLTGGGGRDDPLMQFHLSQLLFDFGAPADRLSAKNGDGDEKFKGTESILVGGYDQIVHALSKGTVKITLAASDPEEAALKAPEVEAASGGSPLQIRLGHQVTGVELDGERLRVTLAAGETLTADHVVCAVPLGVLKAEVLTFEPALPEAKRRAVEELGFGNVVKVCLLFDSAFWQGATEKSMCYYALVKEQPSLREAERFSVFLNLEGLGRPALMTFGLGGSADEVESWSDEQLWSSIRGNLVAIFGEGAVPESCSALWRSAWRSDGNFQGAYSYSAVGCQEQHWEALAEEACGGRLHFAGEHTSAAYRGTAHGAFLSGQRAAVEILRWNEE